MGNEYLYSLTERCQNLRLLDVKWTWTVVGILYNTIRYDTIR